MWALALQRPDDEAGFASCNQAFPYVPFVPEHYGLELTSESLVIDVGCQSGYGMYDFCWRRAAQGRPVPRLLGVDIDEEAVQHANEKASAWAKGMDVAFVRGRADSLPCADREGDMIIARLVLPYVPVAKTLAEFARVLHPGGLVLIQPHTPRYYLNTLWRRRREWYLLPYYLRPLLSRVYYGLTYRQPSHRWFRETALEQKQLERLCAHAGLLLVWSKPIGPGRPLLLFQRR